LTKKHYVSGCESINLHFEDTGIFGLNFTGDSAHSNEIVNDMLEVLDNFRRPIDEQELHRAKNILKRSILNNLSNQGERLEEMARSFNYFGRVRNYDYVDMINNVSSAHIKDAIDLLLQSKPTLVVSGNAVNLAPSIADIQGRLK
jgi:predicted Zn-dependent peptidase